MVRRKSSLLLTLILAATLTACTSSESEKESADAGADLEAAETESGEVISEGDMNAPMEPIADLPPEDSFGTEMKSDEAIEAPLPDTAMEGGDPIVESPSVAPPDGSQQEGMSADMAAPPADGTASSGSEDLFGGGTASSEIAEAPRPVAPLRKIETAPFKRGGVLANTVYLARDGDDLDKVSQKTGASKKDLRKVNSFLRRGVRVGDKIYYNSKSRPEDADRMLTYYEDLNLPPQIYTAKADENIRDIAQNLLGNRESWKELWSTNLDVESKGALPEGTQLRYWPLASDGGASQQMAQNDLPPPPMPDPAMPEAPMPELPPAGGAVGSVEPPPPPPPVEPPPAPAPVEPSKPAKMAKKNEGGFVIPGLDQDTTFTVIGAGILIAGLGAIAMVRRSRAKRLSANTQTQI